MDQFEKQNPVSHRLQDRSGLTGLLVSCVGDSPSTINPVSPPESSLCNLLSLTYVYYYDIMLRSVMDAPRGSDMAKATGSRRSSSKTEVPVWPETLHADSQNGNAERSIKEARDQLAIIAIQPCARPFLTGSGSQTEIDVTLSKQTTEEFLPGAEQSLASRENTILIENMWN